jgi:hypothetical protein
VKMRRVLLVALTLLAATMARPAPVAAEETNAPAKTVLSDDELGDLLQQAIMLARVGLYDEAEARCKQILEQKPDQPTAKELLREIEEQKRSRFGQDAGAEFRRKLSETIVPEVNLRGANPFDALEQLRKESSKLTVDKSEVNFVWQVPADAKLPKVTLNLKQVPLLDVIQYVTAIAKLSFRVDPHAVVIYLPAPEPPAASPDSHATAQ